MYLSVKSLPYCVIRWLPSNNNYILVSFLFGAVFPTSQALLSDIESDSRRLTTELWWVYYLLTVRERVVECWSKGTHI